MAELDIARLHQEIDDQVWRPFKAAFESRDGAALNALYADSVLRVDTRWYRHRQSIQDAEF